MTELHRNIWLHSEPWKLDCTSRSRWLWYQSLLYRAANNGRSTDNVRSELGMDRVNLWMAGHVVQSLTDALREILVFNYLIIMRGSIHVSERKKNEYKTRQTSGQEIPSCCNFHVVIKSCRNRKSSFFSLFYLL